MDAVLKFLNPVGWVSWMPLMLVPMIACFVVVGNSSAQDVLVSWQMPSGAKTEITMANGIVYLALFCLMVETWKSTRTNTVAIVDLILSTILLVAGVVCYVLFAGFGSATFLTLVFIQLIDVLTSMVVMVRAARRDFGITQGVVGGV